MNTFTLVALVVAACVLIGHAKAEDELKYEEDPFVYALQDEVVARNLPMDMGQEVISGHVREKRQHQFIYENNKPVGCKGGWSWERNASYFCCKPTWYSVLIFRKRRCCLNNDTNSCWN